MSPALRALLVVTGVSISGFAVYLVRDSADPAEVKTAALADGFVARAAEAEFRVSPAGIAWLADAGITAPKYVRLQFPVGLGVGKEADGGNVVIFPDLPWRLLDPTAGTLQSATTDTCANRPGVCTLWGATRPFKLVAHHCAWKPNAGAVCGRVNPDGGAALDPGIQNTLQPGRWVGAGCRRKPCVGIAGDPE